MSDVSCTRNIENVPMTIDEMSNKVRLSCKDCEYCYKQFFRFDNLCHCKKSEHYRKEIIGDGIACKHIWSIVLGIHPDGATNEELLDDDNL